MSDILTQSTATTDAEQESLINQSFGEIQRLNEQMRGDQAEIERLKTETRLLSTHSDRLLIEIEAQLEALRKSS